MEDLSYPVLAFDKHSFGIKRNENDLTIVWTSLIRSGWFEGLRIVDSEERTYEVAGVTTLHGVGFLWGFNPLYGRRVKVRLSRRRSKSDLSIEALRTKLLGLLRSWSGWRTRGDYEELVAAIESAKSVRELIASLSKFSL